MRMRIPDFGLVVLVGASGAGKTTFARMHFLQSEILSSDHYRTVVGDDDRGAQTTKDAFDVIATIAARRLRARRIAVIDATNVQPEDRKRYVHLARSEHAPLTAIVLDMPEATCQKQNAGRSSDKRPSFVVRRQSLAMRRHVKTLQREGFRRRLRLRTADEARAAEIVREPLSTDHRTRTGPFDVIGDVHGCARELEALLRKLGYEIERSEEDGAPRYQVTPPAGRSLIFVGDLVGPGAARRRRAGADNGRSRGRTRTRRAGQPRRQAGTSPGRRQGRGQARPGRHTRGARAAAGGLPQTDRGVPDGTAEPLRARRRTTRGRTTQA